MFDITIDSHGIEIDFADAPARVGKVAARAINRSITSGRAYMARQIARETGLKVGTIKDALPTTQATYLRLEARLAASLKKIPLIDFNARGPEPSRGLGSGVAYRIGPRRTRIKDAFIATMKSGHRGVFRRVGRGERKSRGAWSKNLPIVQLYGPSLGHIFQKYRVPAQGVMDRTLAKNFDHDLVYAAAKKQEWDEKFAAVSGVEFDELGVS